MLVDYIGIFLRGLAAIALVVGTGVFAIPWLSRKVASHPKSAAFVVFACSMGLLDFIVGLMLYFVATDDLGLGRWLALSVAGSGVFGFSIICFEIVQSQIRSQGVIEHKEAGR